MKAFFIIALVVAFLVGGILTVRTTRRSGMPGQDVLARAKEREREQVARDDLDSKD